MKATVHIKFLNFGTGDVARAVSYLLATHDYKGALRPDVKVLRGNPAQLASLVSSMSTVHRYTSAVVAWAPEDHPSAGEVNGVLDDFEHLAFAGLEPDQYCHAVVSHGDHVHILVARLELRSGKAMNIAPPVWRGHFDHLRDHWNFKAGWARPDDPTRARLVQRDTGGRRAEEQAVVEVERISAETGVEVMDLLYSTGIEPRPKDVIGDRLLRLVADGEVKNRQDVLAILGQYGSIQRAGKDYVSIRLGEGEKPIRFKGALFHQDFDAANFLEKTLALAPVGRSEPDLVAAAAARLRTVEATAQRAAYNQRRYPKPAPAPCQSRAVAGDDHNESVLRPNLEINEDERNRNLAGAKALGAYRSFRAAVAGLVRVCLEAVSRLGTTERAIAAAQRAGSDAQRAASDAQLLIVETERASRSVDDEIAAMSAGAARAAGARTKR